MGGGTSHHSHACSWKSALCRLAAIVALLSTWYPLTRTPCRWAGRGAVGYQQLAEDGFAVLGERLRSAEERRTVQGVLEKALNVKVGAGPLSEFSMLIMLHAACKTPSSKRQSGRGSQGWRGRSARAGAPLCAAGAL